MVYNEKMYIFAQNWYNWFSNKPLNYLELFDNSFKVDCDSFDFNLSDTFEKTYGISAYYYTDLNTIIDTIYDIQLLGSAIYTKWYNLNKLFSNSPEILNEENRLWFIIAFDKLSFLTAKNSPLFIKTPQMIRFVSNIIAFGPYPQPSDIVEQHLTINLEGKVWFSSYCYGEGEGKYKKLETKNKKIDKTLAQDILSKISKYFINQDIYYNKTDVGSWSMYIKNTEKEEFNIEGSIYSNYEVDGVDLSSYIRESLEMDYLFLFDGNTYSDKINKIIIDYKNNIDNYFVKSWLNESSFLVIEDIEKLIIDRKTESLEILQKIGNQSTIFHKYEIKSEISRLLDDLYEYELFDYLDKNNDKNTEVKGDKKDYTVTVEFNKHSNNYLHESFNLYEMPKYFEKLVQKINNFIKDYGFGEIFNPLISKKRLRAKNDYIFCSVTFDNSNKSYYYITEDESIEVGDLVSVRTNNDDNLTMGKIINIEYFNKNNVPFPIKKTKHIISKCRE